MNELSGDQSSLEDPWHSNPFDDQWTLVSLLRWSAECHGSRPAFLARDQRWLTHQDMWIRAGRLRAVLLESGASPSSAIACITHIGESWVIAVIAVITAGRVYVALEPDSPDVLNSLSLDESGADIVLVEARFSEQAHRLAGSRRVIVIEEAEAADASAGLVDVAPDARAAIVFTAGSTGRPKGVIRSHRSLAHAAYSFGDVCSDAVDTTMLYFGTATHIASLNTLLRSLICGFGLITEHFSTVDLDRVSATLSGSTVNVIVCGPALLRLMLNHVNRERFTDMRHALVSGSPLTGSDLARWYSAFPGVPLMQNYGSTETGPMAAGIYLTSAPAQSGHQPMHITHRDCGIELVDGKGNLVPDGQEGQVRIRSNYLADGYLTAAPELAGRFGSDSHGRFFMTGDLAMRNDSGDLILLTRSDRQVKVRGRRVDLADVENAIVAHEAWAEAVATLATPMPGSATELTALVVPAPNSEADLSELRRYLESHLDHFAIPKLFAVVEAIPMTAAGKVDYPKVERLASQGAKVAAVGVGGPPQGIVENWVADVWQVLLRIDRPGRLDRFSDLGGDSRLAIEFTGMVLQQFGVRMSVDAFAARQTIASLVPDLETGDMTVRAPVAVLRQDFEGPVWLMIPGIGGHAWVFAGLAAELEGPCDVLALSFIDLNDGDLSGGLKHRVRAVAAEVLGSDRFRGRQVRVAGYSFGARVAADLAGSLIAEGAPIERLYLLDPSPESRQSFRQKLGLFRSTIRVRSRLWWHRRADRNLSASAKLELDVAAISNKLIKTYLDGSVRVPSVPVTWAISEEMVERDTDTPPIAFGSVVGNANRAVLPVGHLELMRPPGIYQLADFLNSESGSADRL